MNTNSISLNTNTNTNTNINSNNSNSNINTPKDTGSLQDFPSHTNSMSGNFNTAKSRFSKIQPLINHSDSNSSIDSSA